MKKPTEPTGSTGSIRTEIITIDGESEESLESKNRVNTIKILRERLATLKQSKGRSAEEFFNEFSAEHCVDNL